MSFTIAAEPRPNSHEATSQSGLPPRRLPAHVLQVALAALMIVAVVATSVHFVQELSRLEGIARNAASLGELRLLASRTLYENRPFRPGESPSVAQTIDARRERGSATLLAFAESDVSAATRALAVAAEQHFRHAMDSALAYHTRALTLAEAEVATAEHTESINRLLLSLEDDERTMLSSVRWSAAAAALTVAVTAATLLLIVWVHGRARAHAATATANRHRTVIDRLDSGVMVLGPQGETLLVNEAAGRALGDLDAQVTEVPGPNERRAWSLPGAASAALAAGTSGVREIRVERPGRAPAIVELRIQPLPPERAAAAPALLVECHDVTASRELAQEAERAAAALEAAFAAMPGVVLMVDEQMRILQANGTLSDIFGLDPDAVLGTSMATLFPLASRETVLGSVRACVAGEASCEGTSTFGLRTDGSVVPLDLRLTELETPGPDRRFLVSLQDASDREARHETQERARVQALRTHYIRSMSHELRTPLNSIIGFAQLLDLGISGPLTEAQREHVCDILGAGEHLLGLVNGVLDLSRIDSGRWSLQFMSLDPARVATEVMRTLRSTASSREIALELVTAPDLPPLVADERSLWQILMNLTSNALKFTEPGGRVTVQVTAHDGVARMAVEDTGIGIMPADRERIFEEFVQLDAGFNRRSDGTGLGLPIVRRLAELHGGTVGVDSEPGHGSTFFVELPLEQSEQTPQDEPSAGDETAGEARGEAGNTDRRSVA